MRARDNAISRLVNRFVHDISLRMKEEMEVEGSMVMDGVPSTSCTSMRERAFQRVKVRSSRRTSLTLPTSMMSGLVILFAAIIASGETLRRWASTLSASPGCTTYVTGVGVAVGAGVEVGDHTPEKAPAKLQFGPAMVLALSIASVVVLYIGIFPTTYLNLAMESVKPLF